MWFSLKIEKKGEILWSLFVLQSLSRDQNIKKERTGTLEQDLEEAQEDVLKLRDELEEAHTEIERLHEQVTWSLVLR